MKSARQLAIQQIINTQEVETQDQLAEALQKRGIQVTQATISRDIKELRLIKVPDSSGGYRYAMAEQNEPSINDRFARLLTDSVLSVAVSENMVVVRTLSGSASTAAQAIDSLHWPEVLGTLAGDNTVLMVIRTREESQVVSERLRDMLA